MLISRGPIIGRTIKTIINISKSPLASGQTKRNGGHAWSYRTSGAPVKKSTLFLAQLAGATMWWWVLWHLWHEPEHITGEFPFPDASQWTNAELGIPSDHYDE